MNCFIVLWIHSARIEKEKLEMWGRYSTCEHSPNYNALYIETPRTVSSVQSVPVIGSLYHSLLQLRTLGNMKFFFYAQQQAELANSFCRGKQKETCYVARELNSGNAREGKKRIAIKYSSRKRCINIQ